MNFSENDKKKMFLTDLDGTLLRSDGTFSENDLNTLVELGNKNVTRVIATGRSLFSFQRSVKIKLPVDFIIFSTGAGIYKYPDLDNVIKQNNLDNTDIKKITQVFDSFNLNYMIHEAVPDNHKFLYKISENPCNDFNFRINLYKKYSTPIMKWRADFEFSAQLLAIVEKSEGFSIVEQIREELQNYTVIQTTSPLDHTSVWIEVFSKKVSKSLAAKWIAAKKGVSVKNVLAVGNDYNDIDMLDWAGTRYVVENAPKELKNKYQFVKSNDSDGVSEAVQKWYLE